MQISQRLLTRGIYLPRHFYPEDKCGATVNVIENLIAGN